MPVPHTILLIVGIPVSHAFLRLVSMPWPHDVFWPMPTPVLCASLCTVLVHVLLAIRHVIAGHCSHAVVALVAPVPLDLHEMCRPLICQEPPLSHSTPRWAATRLPALASLPFTLACIRRPKLSKWWISCRWCCTYMVVAIVMSRSHYDSG